MEDIYAKSNTPWVNVNKNIKQINLVCSATSRSAWQDGWLFHAKSVGNKSFYIQRDIYESVISTFASDLYTNWSRFMTRLVEWWSPNRALPDLFIASLIRILMESKSYHFFHLDLGYHLKQPSLFHRTCNQLLNDCLFVHFDCSLPFFPFHFIPFHSTSLVIGSIVDWDCCTTFVRCIVDT